MHVVRLHWTLWPVTSLLVVGVGLGCGAPDDTPGELQSPPTGTIVGQVTLDDSADASGVRVEVGAAHALTEADGSFSFTVATGNRLVVASLEGYEPQQQEVEVVEDEEVEVSLILSRVNAAPEILEFSAERDVLLPGESVMVEVDAVDANGDALSYAWEASEGFVVDAGDASGAAVSVMAPEGFGVSGELRVVVSDGRGGESSAALSLSTRTNAAPIILSMSADPASLAPGGESMVRVVAEDADEDALTVAFSAPEGWVLSVDENDPFAVQVSAPDQPSASAAVVAVVRDPFGAEATQELNLSTAANNGPRVRSLVAVPARVAPGATLELVASAVDADGWDEDLLYEWMLPEGWESDTIIGPTIEVVAPQVYGASARVELIVSDRYGVEDRAEIVVSTEANEGPRITSLIVTPPVAEPGELLEVEASASHRFEDAASLTYAWEAPEGWEVITASRPVGQPLLRAPQAEGVSGALTLTVTDAAGASTSAQTTVQTRTLGAPLITSINTDLSSLIPSSTTRLSVIASDPEGGDLSYAWSGPAGWQIDDASLRRPTITAPAGYQQSATFRVDVSNEAGKSARAEIIVSTMANPGPSIALASAQPDQVVRGGEIELSVDASHPHALELSYAWSVPAGWTLLTEGHPANSPHLQAPATSGESGQVVVTVSDSAGGEASYAIGVHTLRNQAPAIAELVVATSLVAPGDVVEASVVATDADADALTYSWSIPAGWTIIEGQDAASVRVQTPEQYDVFEQLTVTVSDGQAQSSASATIGTRSNRAPQVNAFYADRIIAQAGESIALTIDAEDPDGDDFMVVWESSDPNFLVGTTAPGQGMVQTSSVRDASSLITARLEDAHGATTSVSLRVSTYPNRAPQIVQVRAPASILPGEPAEVQLSIEDADGDATSVAWSVDHAAASLSPSGDAATLSALNIGEAYTATISYEVSDGQGALSTGSVAIQVREGGQPAAFSFVDASVPADAEITSDAVVAAGFEGRVVATVSGPCGLLVDGGPATSSALVEAGQSLQLYYPGGPVGAVSCQLSLAATSASWDLTIFEPLPLVFDTCNTSGRFGPEQAACDTTYADANIYAPRSVTVAAGMQRWSVPTSGTYRIEALGAASGGANADHQSRGARIQAEFELEAGEELVIAVGQMGGIASSGYEWGGGGGTFVVLNDEPLLVAGGGGSPGGCSVYTGGNALGIGGQTTPEGSAGNGGGPAGGTNGNGGAATTNSYPGGAGGGFYSHGQSGTRTFTGGCSPSVTASAGVEYLPLELDPDRTQGGGSFVSGAFGARGCYTPENGFGGFGGGGGAGGCGGAGGGGYSGGGGGTSDNYGGGGGGSFSAGASTVSEAAFNLGHGKVSIERVN
ncbi:Ig-like domain-containing protein [Lujinxingia vulgaris]|uniref:Ig-like domain-containing protein n=1 Tax=Lujinxingia vulgaris TaxID=2600176 RepID=UPI0024BFCDA1|nr:hypothetical protein [Lujinxingia vulgaris]